jgi:hypothetical protein
MQVKNLLTSRVGAPRSMPLDDYAPWLPSDRETEAMLLTALGRQPWWNPAEIRVSVEDGICWFRGRIESEAARNAACAIAGRTPGVRAVLDDMARAPERPRHA